MFTVRVTAKTPAIEGQSGKHINVYQQKIQPVASYESLLAPPTQRNLFNTMTSHSLRVVVDTDRIVGRRSRSLGLLFEEHHNIWASFSCGEEVGRDRVKPRKLSPSERTRSAISNTVHYASRSSEPVSGTDKGRLAEEVEKLAPSIVAPGERRLPTI